MQEFTGPSLSNYLLVLGFLLSMLIGFYYLKKNKHVISQKLNSKKRMKISDVTILGQGDRALILNLDDKEYLFEIKTNISDDYSLLNKNYLIKLGSYGLFNRLNLLDKIETISD